MSRTDQAPEPTMDEILASIRRIIADDEASAAQRAPAPPPSARPQARPQAVSPALDAASAAPVPDGGGDDDILELTNEMFAAVKPQAQSPSALAQPTVASQQPTQAAPTAAPPPMTGAAPEPVPSPAAVLAIGQADSPVDIPTAERSDGVHPDQERVGTAPAQARQAPPPLAADTRAIDDGHVGAMPRSMDTHAPASAAMSGGATSLEACVRELLRPMLREWLEENLPRILEDAVRHELAEQVQEKRRSRH